MEIKYLGHSSFLIKTKDAKVVTDPYDAKAVGMHFPKTECDIVTISHHHGDHNDLSQITGEPEVFDLPGEYEKKGVRVTGYKWYHDKAKGSERGENTLFKYEADGISLLHCGDMGALPDDKLLEEIGGVDILMVPVCGFYTIDAKDAVRLVKEIDPSIVIPMHYNHDKLKKETFEKLTTLDVFLKELGVEAPVALDKLVVKKEDLGDDMKVVTFTM